MSTQNKPKQRHVGFGRRKLSAEEKLERMLDKNLENLYRKTAGNKKKKIAPTNLSPEDAKVLEACARTLQILNEIKLNTTAVEEKAQSEAELEAEALTPELIRETVNRLKQEQQELEKE